MQIVNFHTGSRFVSGFVLTSSKDVYFIGAGFCSIVYCFAVEFLILTINVVYESWGHGQCSFNIFLPYLYNKNEKSVKYREILGSSSIGRKSVDRFLENLVSVGIGNENFGK